MAEAPTEVWSYPTQSVSESFRFAFGIGLPGRIAEFIKAERGPPVECGSRIRSLLGRLDCIGGYWWILIWTKSLHIITMYCRTTAVSSRELWSTMLDPKLGCCC